MKRGLRNYLLGDILIPLAFCTFDLLCLFDPLGVTVVHSNIELRGFDPPPGAVPIEVLHPRY